MNIHDFVRIIGILSGRLQYKQPPRHRSATVRHMDRQKAKLNRRYRTRRGKWA